MLLLRSSLLIAVLCTPLLTQSDALAQGKVLTVDQTLGKAAYIDLQAAVNAAKDGDTIAILSGSFSSMVINNKSLVVDTFTSAKIGTVTIRNLAASKRVVLRNVMVPAGSTNLALSCTANKGKIVLEACTSAAGLYFKDCASITASRCEITSVPAKVACLALNSNLRFFDCKIAGAHAVNAPQGGHGMTLTGGTHFFSSVTITGGNGLIVSPGTSSSGGNGLTINSGKVVAQASTFGGSVGTGPKGKGGKGLIDPKKGLSTIPGTPSTLVSGPMPKEGETLFVGGNAEAGAKILVAVNSTMKPMMFQPCQGMVVPSLQGALIFPLTTSTGGRWLVRLKIPELGKSINTVTIVAQAFGSSRSSSCFLTNPIFVTAVDRSY